MGYVNTKNTRVNLFTAVNPVDLVLDKGQSIDIGRRLLVRVDR